MEIQSLLYTRDLFLQKPHGANLPHVISELLELVPL